MAMTRLDLRTAIRADVRDPSGNRWGDSVLNRHINQGQLELARVSGKIAQWQNAVAANATQVAFPTDMLYPREAAWQTAAFRYELTLRRGIARVQPTEVGSPEDCYVTDENFVLDPIPYEAGTLLIAGQARPADLTLDTDTLRINDADEPVIAYVVYQLKESDGDPTAPLAERRWLRLQNAWMLADVQHHPLPQVLERPPRWWTGR